MTRRRKLARGIDGRTRLVRRHAAAEFNLMANCRACGAEVRKTPFCPKCGAAQDTAPPAPGESENFLAENIAALLCYACGWISGLVFLFIDKRPFVKFHAGQSIAVFGGMTLLRIFLTSAGVFGFGIFMLSWTLLSLAGFVLWIVLMVKAYRHETTKLPIFGDVALAIARLDHSPT
jgi:uncharacterized membrane protein